NEALIEETRKRNESLHLLDTFFEYCPLGLALVDKDLRYLRVNDSIANMGGQNADDYLGKTLKETFPWAWEHIEPMANEVLANGRPVEKEVELTHPDRPGQTAHWFLGFFPVRDLRGYIIGLGIFASEVTER